MGNCQNLPEGFAKKFQPKPKGPSNLIVSTYTWGRDSHGLFDYESKTLSKKVFKAPHAGVIRRNLNECAFAKDNDKTIKQGDKDILKLRIKEGSFWIDGCPEDASKNANEQNAAVDVGSLEQDPWLVVKAYKNNNNKGYKLNEGDIIKLGRIKYRIREVKGAPTLASQKDNAPEKQAVNTVILVEKFESKNIQEADNNASVDESFKKSPRTPKGSQTNVNQTCRICLSETCEPDNPFFSPCNCSGTMKLIHVKCLQTWLKSKIQTKTSGHTTFTYWKTLECELCKTSYPQSFDVENKRYDIVEIDRPNCAYIMLEVLSKETNITRGVHLIKMEGKTNIRMGRGHDSDIRITDISVSRCHAIIRLDKGNYYIEDNNSKFGTLVHLSKPLAINGEMNNMSIQIGRTVVTLATKKGKGMCLGTNGNSANEKNIEHINGLFGDINLNDLASPTVLNAPSSPLSANRAPGSALSQRERAYRIDFISQISHLNTENIIPLVIEPPQENQNNNRPENEGNEINNRPLNVERNEGDIGADAEERSIRNE